MRLNGLAVALAVATTLVIPCGSATATEYHVAPGRSGSGDGSAAHPFVGVSAALESGRLRAGDKLLLATGDYGRLRISGQRPEGRIEITAAPDSRPHVDGIVVSGSRNLTISGLVVWPPGPEMSGRYLVQVEADTDGINLLGLEIRGAEDAEGFMSWDGPTWKQRVRHGGIGFGGANGVVKGNRLQGVANGISVSGPDVRVEANSVDGFRQDGMRGQGDNGVFVGNRVQNCVKVDGNHDDGFQAWATRRDSTGQKVHTGLVLDGNMILEWTGRPDHPLRCRLQGIGMFNGLYRNVLIRNNLVATRAHHGITVLGGEGVYILNNTVVRAYGETSDGGLPRLTFRPAKSGAVESAVANNIAMSFAIPKQGKSNVQVHANQSMSYPYRALVDPAAFDFRPRRDGPLSGAADPKYLPRTDIVGTLRPLGPGGEPGAYEID